MPPPTGMADVKTPIRAIKSNVLAFNNGGLSVVTEMVHNGNDRR